MQTIRIKYKDEKKIEDKEFTIGNLLTYADQNTTFVHNEKSYEVESKTIFMDEDKDVLYVNMKIKS